MRNKFAVVWIWLVLLPLAFDIKGVATVDKIIPILLTVTSMGAACAVLLIAPRFARRSRMRTLVTSLLLLTVFGSAATHALQGNDAGNYARVILPFLLMLLGYFVGCRPWDSQRLAQIERALAGAMIASLVVSVGFDVAMGDGIGYADAGSVPVTFLCLQALLLHELVFAKHFPKLTVALFVATIVIEWLFVTRSLFVGTLLLFVYATWLAAPSIRHFFGASLRAVTIVTLLGAMAAASASFFPAVAERWLPEVSLAQDDAAIARLAEMKAQVDQATSSALSTLVGMGYGHDYRYSPSTLREPGEDNVPAIKNWTAGHDFWVYQFFAGGLLFGLALPIAVLLALWRASMAYRAWRHSAPDARHLPELGRALLMLAALPATSIGGNPLGNGFAAIVFGVALGVAVATYARISNAMQIRAAGAAGKQPQPAYPHYGVPPDPRAHDEPLTELLPAATLPAQGPAQKPPERDSLAPNA
ncbi:hypothetical protein AWB75_00679 [Caballeronia catudaia]|uniref:O-antigen polymerase family protein n=1 Tax=Caballeronia catudaia TaxID=1777136 RepID=A0A157ZFK9_9BURK|nr:hypothetical protein [Caballeronia catudaia]SAK44308.1 hypothetical protein AWB75_00679 [Caballeronia catudaia]